MPQSCPEHGAHPQISCEVCYPDSELQMNLERMQSVKLPTSRAGEGKKKPKRLDDTPKKRRTWRDELFS